ncbi:MAG: hypothetical protein AAB433_21370 [Nitrospirota bacterium]
MDGVLERLTTNGMATITVRLGNQDFSLERKLVPVNSLKLDATNQRVSYVVRKKAVAVTDHDLHKLIWDMDPVHDLYQSIFQNGGLIEDPIVRRDGTVVEGNCRTVALRELHKKYPQDKRFSQVYVRYLPEDVTEEQLTLLLGELHIAGKIEWRAYEQAEYVWKMHKIFGKTYDYLASHLRWSRSKLAQKIAAYEETKSYIEESGDPNGINRFSHFEEFMKKKELREKRETDSGFMKQFRKWVFENKFPDAKDVRDLPEILGTPDAMKKFEKNDVRGAKEILQEANPSLVSNLYYYLDEAVRELKNIALVELEDLKSGNKVKEDKFRSLYSALMAVSRHTEIKF